MDILQSLSIFLVHGLLGVTPLVSNGEKAADEKVSTVQKEVKRFVPEPLPVDIRHSKKESKKKK